MKKVFGLILLSILMLGASACEPQVVEVIKEVEVTREVPVEVEVIKEVPVEVEVIKEVEVPVEEEIVAPSEPLSEWEFVPGGDPPLPWETYEYVVCFGENPFLGNNDTGVLVFISVPPWPNIWPQMMVFCRGYGEEFDVRYWQGFLKDEVGTIPLLQGLDFERYSLFVYYNVHYKNP